MFLGHKKAYIGIGGGSDCIQAFMLAQLQQGAKCVVSIRRDKSGSQTADQKMGAKRSVENHGGEVAHAGSGVYRILPETTGSGRFLEFLPATKVPTYLVIDHEDGKLTEQLSLAIADFGGVDSIIAVDTGGDSLFRVEQDVNDATRATPDQDIASLQAIARMQGYRLYSTVVAKGVDTPDYADQILGKAEARYIELDRLQTVIILDRYKEFKLDGSNPDLFGKTALAWQSALRQEFGKVSLPLPQHLIDHPTNPWNPVVEITADMAGIYVMDLVKHLRAISEPPHAPRDPSAVEAKTKIEAKTNTKAKTKAATKFVP